jgi:PST family polysaccharide transporter
MKANKGTSGRAALGAFQIILSQGARVILTVSSTIAVARLLDPADFGVVAMAAPVMAFIWIFQDLGFNQAIVQRDTISDQQINAMFWIALIGSTAATAVMLLLSPAVGLFYGDIRAAHITAAFSANVLLAGTALQHSALLHREMKFGRLAAIDILAALVNFVVTVTAAYYLRNFWALWLGGFAGTTVNVILLWSLNKWRPKLHVSFSNIRNMVEFGANLTTFNLINFLHRNLDNILIARVWGAYQLGLYDQSYKLMMFPLQNISNPLARVMIPALSRLQNDPDRYRRTFLLALRVLLAITIPGIAVAASMSDRILPFLLGSQWADAGPIFFWLSLAALPQMVGNATGWLFISCGRARSLRNWGLFSGIVFVSGFVAGLPWGATGVARAYMLSMTLIIFPVLCVWATRGTPIATRDLYGVLIEPLGAAAITWVAVKYTTDYLPIWLHLALALVLSYSVALASQVATVRGRQAVRDIRKVVAQAVST